MKKKIISKPKKKIKKPLLKRIARNNLEKKVRLQTDELKESRGQLRQGVDREKLAEEQIHILTKAIEAALDGIFIIDALKPNFPIVYANQSFYAITGYNKRDILGSKLFFTLWA